MTTQAERTLQSEILYRLNRYPVVAIPVPNGIWVPARGEAEEDIVQDLKHAHLSGDPPETPEAAPLVRGHCGKCAIADSTARRSRLRRPTGPTGCRECLDYCKAPGALVQYAA